MSVFSRKHLVGLTLVTACILGSSVTPAVAGTLYKGWNYTADALGDGSPSSALDSAFDIKGIAIAASGSSVYVAISANTPLGGVIDSNSRGGATGWGDLFFNFTGQSFATASSNNSLFGVRFTESNDSTVAGVGVYGNVQGLSVTQANGGYGTLDSYYTNSDGLWNQPQTQGDLATREAVNAYYGSGSAPIQSVIGSGTYLGGITYLSLGELEALKYDSNLLPGGAHTIGFKFDRNLLPKDGGNFFANLFLECGNDGVTLSGDLKAVPEPSAMVGLMAFGLLGLSQVRKRRQSTNQ